jgi:virulence factor Mce-like protein
VRRLAAIAACALVALAAAGFLRGQAQAGGDYRVDVIFDNAHGLIPGQLAQIAGARVGTIEDVSLTPDFRARIKLKVSSRFAPFRKDAHCTIRPQGLIAENYVDCDPGTPDAAPLRGTGGEAPTVPVGNTTAPVAVTDLFDVWSAPVRDRVTVLLSELGLTTAGRGQDINEILRRANPSLKLARKVISILHRQRDQLGTILDSTDQAISGLAARSGRVRDFVHQAAVTSRETGAHSRALGDAVRRLPGLLAATEPALRDLDTVVTTGTPLVRRLHEAAPAINRLNNDIGPFARAAQPTITALRPVLGQGIRSLQKAAPVSRLLKGYAHRSLPAAQLAGTLFTNLRDTGFAESLLQFIYGAAAGTARFDDIGHILPAFITLNACSLPATTPVAGCSANYTRTPNTTRAPAAGKAPAARPETPAVGVPGVKLPQAPALPAVPTVTDKVIRPVVGVVKDVVDKILHPSAPKPPKDGAKEPLGGLLGYLLG